MFGLSGMGAYIALGEAQAAARGNQLSYCHVHKYGWQQKNTLSYKGTEWVGKDPLWAGKEGYVGPQGWGNIKEVAKKLGGCWGWKRWGLSHTPETEVQLSPLVSGSHSSSALCSPVPLLRLPLWHL